MDASRKSILKLVFGIAIPILIMIVTMVMVGMSFAWFTDADKVTIESITMSTAEAYRISFARQNELCNNIEYMGQTALTKDGYLMSKAKAGENTLLQNDRAYYFVNAVSLDTLGKKVDFRMSFDGAKIYQVQKDANGNVVNGEDGNPVVIPKKLMAKRKAPRYRMRSLGFSLRAAAEQAAITQLTPTKKCMSNISIPRTATFGTLRTANSSSKTARWQKSTARK